MLGGFGYPFYSGEWITLPRLAEFDAKCYDINVPDEVEYKQSELFCSCMHMSKLENNKEKSKYCANLIKKWYLFIIKARQMVGFFIPGF